MTSSEYRRQADNIAKDAMIIDQLRKQSKLEEWSLISNQNIIPQSYMYKSSKIES